MHLALVCFCFEADARQVFANPFVERSHEANKSYTVNTALSLAYQTAHRKARREAIQRGESEATHFGIVEFYGCFLFLNVLAFYGCLKYLLASMS